MKPAGSSMPSNITAPSLLEANASASIILDAIPLAIVATDQDGVVTYWSSRAETVFGWPAVEATGKPIDEICSCADLVRLASNLASGAPSSSDCIVEGRGEATRIRITATASAGIEGRPSGFILTGIVLDSVPAAGARSREPETNPGRHDVGCEVTTSIAMREVMNRTLFEHATDGFMVTDATGRIEEVNGSWLRLLGYTRAEAITLTVEDLIDPEELAHDPVRYRGVAGSGSLIRPRRMKRKDGSIFPAEINATWFSESSVLTIVRDISDRVRAEKEVRESEAKYRSVVENAGDGIVMADRNGRVIDANRRAMEMVGYTMEEGKGMALADFLTAEEVQANPPSMAEIVARGTLVRERTLKRKDGTTLQVEVSATISPDGLYIGFLRDLSERKKAELELKASEENYRRIVELSPDAIVVHVDGTMVYANDAAVRLVGAANRDQLTGRSVLEFLKPEFRDRVVERIDRVMNRNLTAPPMEQQITREDGSTVDVETVGIPLNYRGKPAVQVVVRDISARKRGEEALRSSEERYRGIVERATDAMYLVTETGMLTDANPATLAITGWSLEEILSKNFIELVHPDDRARARALFLSSQEEAQREPEVFRIRTPSGDYIYLEMTTTPVLQQSGDRALFGIGRDITAARRAEQQIRFQASLLANVRNAVIAIDNSGLIIYWNHHAELLYGWSAEEALGRNVEDVMAPRGLSPLVQARADLAATGRWEGEARARRRDGSEVDILLVLATVIDETGRVSGVVGSSFDVTKLHEAERELEQARRFSGLGRLAATVAHEFNNVMMGIYPFAEIIKRSEDPQMGRASVHVTEALQRGKQITQEILKFARASEPLLAPVDVSLFLYGAMDELQAIAGTSVTVEVEASPGTYMMADGNQMQQVFSNLVANGRDAMHGGGTISIKVNDCAPDHLHTRMRITADMVCISVGDTGCGIPDSELPLIFEPMFTTKRSTGTGLGLAVVHQILTRHGGEVIVETTPGVGTTFYLMIPRSEAPAAAALPETKVSHRPSRLVLVEDDPHVGAGLIALLELEGIEMRLATLGRDAVGAIEAFRPDAVILDVGLPDIDGVSVFGDIAARWPDLPVVFSTGHGDEGLLEAALKRPHVGYLLKPYGIDELLEVLARIA